MAKAVTSADVEKARREYDSCKRARLAKGKQAWPEDTSKSPLVNNCKTKYETWQRLVALRKAQLVASKPALEAAAAAGAKAAATGQAIAEMYAYDQQAQDFDLPEVPPGQTFVPSTPEDQGYLPAPGSTGRGVPTWALIGGGLLLFGGVIYLALR